MSVVCFDGLLFTKCLSPKLNLFSPKETHRKNNRKLIFGLMLEIQAAQPQPTRLRQRGQVPELHRQDGANDEKGRRAGPLLLGAGK
jgi:hypothetical protein